MKKETKNIEVCDFRYDEGVRTRTEKQIMPTLTTHGGGISGNPMVKEKKQNNLRIRKLTPRECYRLMGFNDKDFSKAKEVNSNKQLYKQAGNSIVVNVLENIFKQMGIGQKENQLKTIELEIEETKRQIDVTKSKQRKYEMHRHLNKLYRKYERIKKHERQL